MGPCVSQSSWINLLLQRRYTPSQWNWIIALQTLHVWFLYFNRFCRFIRFPQGGEIDVGGNQSPSRHLAYPFGSNATRRSKALWHALVAQLTVDAQDLQSLLHGGKIVDGQDRGHFPSAKESVIFYGFLFKIAGNHKILFFKPILEDQFWLLDHLVLKAIPIISDNFSHSGPGQPFLCHFWFAFQVWSHAHEDHKHLRRVGWLSQGHDT